MILRKTLAGLPTTIVFGSTSFVTTAPAPTMAFLPIVTPPKIVAEPPIHTLSSTVIGLAYTSHCSRCLASIGCIAV